MSQEPHLPPRRPPTVSSSSSCPRHRVTGLCAACLRERLSLLEPSPSPSSSSHRPNSGSETGASSQLRRSHSFSVRQQRQQPEGISTALEPQRRSCDVRLWNAGCGLAVRQGEGSGAGGGSTVSGGVVEGGSSISGCAVEGHEGNVRGSTFSGCAAAEGPAANPAKAPSYRYGRETTVSCGSSSGVFEAAEVAEGKETAEVEEAAASNFDFGKSGLKRMKDHIISDAKKNPDGADKGSSISTGGFFNAFGRKFQRWRGKKKGSRGGPRGADENVNINVKGGNWSQPLHRDAQSEVADYGFSRRSYDHDLPRFSLDAGRPSMDFLPRQSLDNPRPSWDGGYTMGGRHPIRRPMSKDLPVTVIRSDNKIPVEEPPNSINQDPGIPGGSLQTREYYLDSSSQRRRRSFERSRSARRITGPTIEEMKMGSISKVSPALMDYLHRNRIADSRAPSLCSSSLRDDRSESLDSCYRDVSDASRIGTKKGGWWSKSMRILGFSQRRPRDESSKLRENLAARSMSMRCDANGEFRGILDRKLFHEKNAVDSRSSFSYNPFGIGRGDSEDKMNGLKRNQSARYPSSSADAKITQLNSSHHRRKGSLGNGLKKSGSMNSEASAKIGLRFF